MASGEAVVAGDTIIVVYESGTKAMSTKQNSNNRGQVDVTISNTTPKTITLNGSTTVQALTVAASANSGWTLYTGVGYLYAPNYASGTSNYLRTETSNKDGSGGNWTISYNSMTAAGNGTRRFIKYNTGSSIFSCYQSSSTAAINVYKKAHAVTYKANGGSTTCSDATLYKSNATVTVCSTTPTRSGYTFTGWSANVNLINASTSATITAGSLIDGGTTIKMPAKHVVFTAQWESAAPASPAKTVYLKPNAIWNVDGARFAVYYWKSANTSDNAWLDMTSFCGPNFKATIPEGYDKFIFCRMDGSKAANNWDNKWNQTLDLDKPAANDTCYTISSINGCTDSKSCGSWGTYTCPSATTIYLNPNSIWDADGARFAAYYWEGEDSHWVDFEAACGAVTTEIPGGYTNIILCRMNGATATNNWSNTWNQTENQVTTGHNNYVFTISSINGCTDGKSCGAWTTYAIPTYTISYNKGTNGTGTNTSDTKTCGTTLTLKGAIFTRTGYNLTGWATSDGGAKVYDVSGSYTANAAATLYPVWTAKTTTISFNQNGGTGGQSSTKTATYGSTMPTTITTPTKAGYTFSGYFENSGGTGTKYYNADGSSATNWNKENSTWTLYAGWTAKEDIYKTALHTSAASWTTYASGVTKSGGQYDIPNPGSVAKGATSTCEDTHYHFAGWVTDANKEAGTISGNIIAATGKADATGTTYWAVWEKETSGGANSIELNYSNLSVSTSSYAQSSATVGGVGFTINQGYRGGSNPNYLIQMNSSKGDGTLFNTTAISGLDSIKLYCATAGATATIYQGSSEKPTSTSNPDERVGTAACAASTNYKIAFTGSGEYFTLKVGGATYFSKIEVYYSTYDDPKVECEACAATPSITGVSLSGSTFSLTSVPVQATGASAGTNCAISSYGFCWGTSASPTGNSTASMNLSEGTFSTTLTGTFSVGQTYHYRAFATNNGGYTGYSSDGTFTLRSVTFNLNGHGSSTPSTQYVNNGGKATDPSYSESVTNWRFVGWYDEAACRDGHEWVFGTNTVSEGNATIYAKWLPDPTITFSVPTGVDAISSQRASVNLPTPSGFPTAISSYSDQWAFAGWTESSSVNSTSAPATLYPAGAPYSGSQTSAFTLYAVYSRNKYLVVYDNGMLVANTDYVISTWNGDNYAIVGIADGNNAEVADMDDNFHDKILKGLHYYTLDNPTENAVWHLTGTSGSYVLQNKATGKYLDLSSTSSPMIVDNNTTAALSITEGTGENAQTYKLTKTSNHLVIASSGASVATGDATYYFLYKLLSSKYMTTPAEPTFTVTWKVAGESDQTSTVAASTGIAASDISALTIPGDDHLEIKNSGCITNTKGKFMGWSTTELGSESGQSAPGDLFKTYDKAPYLTDDITLYAVFAEATGTGDPFYEKVTSTGDISSDGRYLIVSEGGIESTKVPAFKGSLASLDATADTIQVTISEDKIDVNSTTEANEFTIDVTNKYVKSASKKYINQDSWNNGLTSNADATPVQSIGIDGSGNFELLGTGKSGDDYVQLKYNKDSGQKRFRFYKSGQQDVQLYKYNPGVTYSDYRTSCCPTKVTLSHNDPSNGSVAFSPAGLVTTCDEDKEVALTITPAAGYQLTGWTVNTASGYADAKTTSPAVVTNNNSNAAQNITLTFAEGANKNYDVTATFGLMTVTSWTWTLNSAEIANPLELYVGQSAKLDVAYTPAGVDASKKTYTRTKVDAYINWVGAAQATYSTISGKASTGENTTEVTFTHADGPTNTVNVKVLPLPLVHFADLVHGKTFGDVVASIEANALSPSKTTPTCSDWTTPNANSCETNHLHLVGWIREDWPALETYLNGGDQPSTSAITTAGNDGSGNAYYFEAGAAINVLTFNGVTFYAVWAKVE